MYQKLKIGLIFLLILGMITGCGNHKRVQTNAEDQEMGQKNITIKDDKGATLIQATWQEPDLSGYFSGAALQNVQKYRENLLSQKKEDWNGILKDQAEQQKKREGKGFLSYQINDQSTITAATDTYVSLQRTITQYTGGNQENTFVYGDTFLKKNGALLLWEDLFQADQGEKTILQYIDQQMEKRTDISYYVDAKQQAQRILEENPSYYLTGDSLVVIYQASDLAPYADGTQIFALKFSDLQGILSEDYFK